MDSQDQQDTRERGTSILKPVARMWQRLPHDIRLNLELNFLPEDPRDKLLPDEKIQLEFGLAWYRDIVGHFVLHYTGWFLGIVLLATIGTWLLTIYQNLNGQYIFIPPIIAIALFAYGIYEHVEHIQWRFVKTNARIVISIPVHQQWPLVDNIEMKGAPNVVDTNWSKNYWWRLFQVFTGARDLYISLVPIQFEEKSAKVKGALIIPDVMPDDVWELKKLVFKAYKPQAVRFTSPQSVIVVEEENN